MQGREEYIQVDLGKGVMLDMVKIPGGSFLMGSPESEADRCASESPQHRVMVSDFTMGKYPITQAQWHVVMGTNPSHFKGKNRPVEKVSWEDAQDFCRKLSKKTERAFRLPSEAEWEYACRGETASPFYFGSNITPSLVNYNGRFPYAKAPEGVYRGATTPVGNFPPNAYGLYDLHGNVWEWCQDHWHENYNGAPLDGTSWVTEGDSGYRSLRGGSWFDSSRYGRSANRYAQTADSRYKYIGFRVVCSVAKTCHL